MFYTLFSYTDEILSPLRSEWGDGTPTSSPLKGLGQEAGDQAVGSSAKVEGRLGKSERDRLSRVKRHLLVNEERAAEEFTSEPSSGAAFKEPQRATTDQQQTSHLTAKPEECLRKEDFPAEISEQSHQVVLFGGEREGILVSLICDLF